MRTRLASLLLSLLIVACSGEALPSGPGDFAVRSADPAQTDAPDPPPPAAEQIAASSHANLQWKRAATFESDLAAALELTAEELCSELGSESCTRVVHLAPLGGHDPFKSGLLEPAAEPLATTPAVVDRVVLSACTRRVELDRKAARRARVFRGFALDGPAPEPEAAKQLITQLYRRLLARDPAGDELALLGKLTRGADDQPVPAREFATLACFTIATTTEFLFF
jgi:hypothetical protein